MGFDPCTVSQESKFWKYKITPEKGPFSPQQANIQNHIQLNKTGGLEITPPHPLLPGFGFKPNVSEWDMLQNNIK